MYIKCHWRARVLEGTESRVCEVVRAGVEIRVRAAMLPGFVRYVIKRRDQNAPESQAAPIKPVAWAMLKDIGVDMVVAWS